MEKKIYKKEKIITILEKKMIKLIKAIYCLRICVNCQFFPSYVSQNSAQLIPHSTHKLHFIPIHPYLSHLISDKNKKKQRKRCL